MSNNNKIEKCIYCSIRKVSEKDHVPPQCLFSSPKPSNLITVPCCATCNRNYGKIDERIRNILTSLDTTENHNAIQSQIAYKRNKSFERKKGFTNLQHVLHSLQNIDIYTQSGIYLGKKPAFKLDQPIFDKFFERLARAFLYIENHLYNYKAMIEWKLSPKTEDIHNMPKEMREFFANPRVLKSIGNNIFQYAGWFLDNVVNSLWAFRFYDGIEFMVRVIELEADN